MPYFKRKPFKIEAQQVTDLNINEVYAWVNTQPGGNAHSLTSDTFVMSLAPNISRTVRLTDWVINYHDGGIKFGILANATFPSRFEPLSEGEDLPFIYTQDLDSPSG